MVRRALDLPAQPAQTEQRFPGGFSLCHQLCHRLSHCQCHCQRRSLTAEQLCCRSARSPARHFSLATYPPRVRRLAKHLQLLPPRLPLGLLHCRLYRMPTMLSSPASTPLPCTCTTTSTIRPMRSEEHTSELQSLRH